MTMREAENLIATLEVSLIDMAEEGISKYDTFQKNIRRAKNGEREEKQDITPRNNSIYKEAPEK